MMRTAQPALTAISVAVCTARRRGLLAMTAGASAASCGASACACAQPRTSSGMSMLLPSSTVSVGAHAACRTSTNRVVMFHLPAIGWGAAQRYRLAGAAVLADEFERELVREMIRKLLRRRFHEITRRADQGAADAFVEGEFRAAHGIDDDAGGIGRIP